MAEFVMKDLVKKAGLEQEFHIESAATSREEIGNPVYPPARRKLAEHGIDCTGKTARQLQNHDYDQYDLLIGMDQENLHDIYRICGGDFDGKMHLLMEYAGKSDQEVADPWLKTPLTSEPPKVRTSMVFFLFSLIYKGFRTLRDTSSFRTFFKKHRILRCKTIKTINLNPFV